MYSIKYQTAKHTLPIVVMGVFAVALGVFLFSPITAHAAISGPRDGSTFVSDSTIGTRSWSNPGNAATNNGSRAIANMDPENAVSRYLKATNFGFSIPAGSTIDGIKVEVEKKQTGGDTLRISDNSVRLVKGGVISGNNKSTGTNWPNTEAYITYGGAADLWGQAWTATDINATNFGFVISAKKDNQDNDRNAEVDHIRITVYYTLPPATINVSKVVCDSEEDLPNWGANEGDQSIGADTASTYIANSNGKCHPEDFSFQYKVGDVPNPGDNTGAAAGWTTFTSSTSVDVSNVTLIKVREIWNDDYITFTGNTNSNSAELYCYNDNHYYDNFDYIRNPQAGQTYYCVGFNVLNRASITLHKNIANKYGDATVPGDFTLKIDDSEVSQDVAHEVTANSTHTISEDGLAGYEFSSITGEGCPDDINQEFSLTPGEDITCTITNHGIQPKLTVIKEVVGGPKTVADFPLFVDDTPVVSGEQNGFDVGYYHVNETNQPNYIATFSQSCIEDGYISLNLGDEKTCTITNTYTTYNIHGYKWNDLNGNGVYDCPELLRGGLTANINASLELPACEPKLAGWTIQLKKDGEVIDTKVTDDGDDFGWYWFTGVEAGTYEVCEVPQSGWNPTYPASASCHTVTVPRPSDSDTCTPETLPNAVAAPSYCAFGNQEVPKVPVLGISKTVDKPTANEGDTLTYTITVANKGNGDMNNLMVTDTLPTNTTLVADSFNPVPNANDGTHFTWIIASVPATNHVDIVYKVTVNSGLTIGTTNIDNTAVLNCNINDEPTAVQLTTCPIPDNTNSKVTTTVTKVAPGTPLLTITKSVDKSTTNPGTTLNYTVVVKNTGTADAANVTLTDTLPAGLTFLDDAGNITTNTTKTWTWPTLAVGASQTVTYKVNVAATATAQSYVNTASASATGIAAVQNTATTAVVIPKVLGAETATLTIAKSIVGKTSANPGDKVMYQVKITNTSQTTATSVVLSDTLPNGFVFTDNGKKTDSWALGNIAPLQTVVKNYEVKLDKAVLAGKYLNTAVAKADNAADVSAQATLEVKAVKVLGAETTTELPVTGPQFMHILYLLGAILLVLASLFVLKLTSSKS